MFGTSEPGEGVRWEGHGTANVFDELAQEILSAGYRFDSFHALVDELWRSARQSPELLPQGALYRLT